MRNGRCGYRGRSLKKQFCRLRDSSPILITSAFRQCEQHAQMVVWQKSDGQFAEAVMTGVTGLHEYGAVCAGVIQLRWELDVTNNHVGLVLALSIPF